MNENKNLPDELTRLELIEWARNEGICILCFAKMQTNAITVAGDNTEFCRQCAEHWHGICQTGHMIKQTAKDTKDAQLL